MWLLGTRQLLKLANQTEESDQYVTGWKLIRAKLLLYLVSMFRRMTLGSRGVLVDGDKVLLIRHTYVKGWQFPGGGVDAGETMENTMRREVAEETGYETVGEAIMHGVFLNNEVSKRDHVALYIVKDFRQVRQFKPNREIAEVRWFDVNELPEDMTRSARTRVAEIFLGEEKSLFW